MRLLDTTDLHLNKTWLDVDVEYLENKKIIEGYEGRYKW
ncbi:hypothetical protein SMGD1_1993 [Sulfurimonas gotlandica GD1]|uniref:Uncharacterized protein n=1 Tax=Sulfurimonas gotlandica (strain DSM 19862 / JCM 16533 / GD1) TaxID=929558 RepID=B6BJ02_SULGG|nr:hypothetical protein CBGD1_836 [Sulfurimonas gotlandica GD1]EHP30516.1 hypothetical protein SMGD1_1993 [Sulfurimonas gotlandica GD1]